jgi:predicted permease
MSTSVVFQQMLMIFILIGIGFVIYKKKWCSQKSSRDLSFLITMVCNPAIMLSSALEDTGAVTRQDILVTAGIAAVVFLGLVILGYTLPWILRVPAGERRFYNLMTVYGNQGFIGIPVVSAVLGASAVIYVTIFIFFFNILIYTHGILVLNPGEKKEDGPLWKKFLNIGTIAGILTLVLFWFRIPLPHVISESISYIGRCTTFLSMVVLGAALSNLKIREIFTVPKLYIFTAVRFVLIPILAAFILKQFFSNELMIQTSVLMLAMPVANMPLMMAKQYDMECEVMSKGIMLTTLLSLVTITIISVFL